MGKKYVEHQVLHIQKSKVSRKSWSVTVISKMMIPRNPENKIIYQKESKLPGKL